MLIFRAVALFVASFLVFAGIARALPGLPRLASEAWRAVSHEQGPARAADGASALALYADRYGHFLADAETRGETVRFMVDSGASYVGLTGEDAERLGLDPAPEDFTLRVGTANGAINLAPVVLSELKIGHIVLRDVAATISPKGALHESLLGMTALGRFERVELSRGRMLLVP